MLYLKKHVHNVTQATLILITFIGTNYKAIPHYYGRMVKDQTGKSE